MKSKLLLILVIFPLVITISSCVHKVPGPEITQSGDWEKDLFSKAEYYFETQNFSKAERYYTKYLEDFPNGEMAPAALFKLGAIESALRHYGKARDFFENLVKTYPESYFIPDAQIEIIFSYYKEKNYEEVITKAATYSPQMTGHHLLRLSAIVGDAYMALGNPQEAVFSYLRAQTVKHSDEERTLSEKLYKAIKKLNTSEIISVLPHIKDDRALSLLTFRLGATYAEMGNTEDGIKMLASFIGNFPDHDKVPEARKIIENLNSRSQYPVFTVGCLLPLSGPYEPFGKKALNGIELALKQIKSIRAQTQIRIIIKDTASDDNVSKVAVQELVDEGALVIIGPITTAEAAAEKAQELRIPIILFSQKPGLTETGDYVFRNFLTPEMQVKTLADYIFNELELTRFAILYPNEKYGTTFMNLFWDEVLLNGGTVTGVEPYEKDNTDFSTPIKKLTGIYYEIPAELLTEEEKWIKERKRHEDPEAIVDFDAIFIPEASAKAGLIAPQLTYHDIVDVYLLGTNLWHSKQMIDMAKKEVQGAIIPDGFFSESTKPHVRSFVKNYEDIFEETPGFIEGIAYDTANILFEIADSPNAHIRDGVKYELTWIKDFPGVTGKTTFDETGEAMKKLYLLQIQGKKFVEIDYSGGARHETAAPDVFTGTP